MSSIRNYCRFNLCCFSRCCRAVVVIAVESAKADAFF